MAQDLSEPGPDEFPVFFGTNRRVDTTGAQPIFTDERDEKLNLGRCLVRVPEKHKFGSVGSSVWVRAIRGEDRLTLTSAQILSGDAFAAALHHKLGDAKQLESSLLYIHGYNNTFEQAAIRAAQIGVDLMISGVTAAFSWPSRGTVRDYKADEATIDASETSLEEFIRKLLDIDSMKRLNIIAHSMGNRAMLRVAQRLPRAMKNRIGQIILAAPDVDAQLFRQLAIAYRKLAKRTTLYVSNKDRAVGLSAYISDYDRAGYAPPVTLVDGIDTIEVSQIDLSILGHGYFAEAHPILHDMLELIRHGTIPDERARLKRRLVDQKCYWQFAS